MTAIRIQAQAHDLLMPMKARAYISPCSFLFIIMVAHAHTSPSLCLLMLMNTQVRSFASCGFSVHKIIECKSNVISLISETASHEYLVRCPRDNSGRPYSHYYLSS
jgi:hypothetical protein